jgi:hypothetical protein
LHPLFVDRNYAARNIARSRGPQNSIFQYAVLRDSIFQYAVLRGVAAGYVPRGVFLARK